MRQVAATTAALLFLVTACSDGSQARGNDATSPPPGGRPQLRLPPGPAASYSEVQLPSKPRESWIHGSYQVCLDEPGEVTVTGVEFESGDADLTAWALRPNPFVEGKNGAGDVRGTLAGHGIENTPVLTKVCDGHGNTYELALQVRAAATSTYGNVVVVRYTGDGAGGSLALPDKVVLCVRPEKPECLPPGYGEPG